MKKNRMVKVQLKHRLVEKSTWEIEKDIWEKYPLLFEDTGALLFPYFSLFLFDHSGMNVGKLVYIVMTFLIIMYNHFTKNSMLIFFSDLKL